MKKIWLLKLMRGYLAPLSLGVFLFILSSNIVHASAPVYNSQLLTTDNLVSSGWTNTTGYTYTKDVDFSACENPFIIENADEYTGVRYSVYFNDVEFTRTGLSSAFDAYNERYFVINHIIPNSDSGTLKIVNTGPSDNGQHTFLFFCGVDPDTPILENVFNYQEDYSGWSNGTQYDYTEINENYLHLALSFSRYYSNYSGYDYYFNPTTDFTEIYDTGRGNVLRLTGSYATGIDEFVIPYNNGYSPDTANFYLTLNGATAGGLSFEQVQYNPATGNVFLAGTCTKYGSGQYQMTLDASTNFNTETYEWDSIDPFRKSLVHCLDDGTFTALYNGTGLTGTTTLILDDSFYGTQIATTDVVFYETTGYISYNWGDLVSISTLPASGTPVSLPFIYDVCDDPEYNATSSYIYLATDAVVGNEVIHHLDYDSPKVQIDTCSGATHIDFTMPYNSNFEGEGYFAYANSYDVITLKSAPFYIFAHPQTLKDGSNVYFANSAESDSCEPPSYNLDTICAGIPSTTLGDVQCGFKYALVTSGQFLFLPSCNSRTYITNQFYKFKGAFPFNAFFDLTGTIGSAIISAQNSTTTSQGIAVPFIRKTATSTEYYMMSVATSTSFSNLIGETNYNLYLTTLGFVWWIIIGGVIFFIIWKV